MSKGILYTIGYAGFPEVSSFIAALVANGVDTVVDVRSSPYSAYYKQYDKEAIHLSLAQNGIHYGSFAEEFGARQENPLYHSNGYLDFERYILSEQFLSGVSRVADGISRGYSPALMCAEKNPIDCHRAIMVSRVFYEQGFEVRHILADGSCMTQSELEEELLGLYYPDRDQASIFGNKPDIDLVKDAYRKQNEKIGYRLT